MQQYTSHSVNETESIAKEIAAKLSPGDVIAFLGGLGAGKTAFVRGLFEGLGCKGEAASPTFAIVHEYPGSIPLYHFDMYRVHTLDDLYSTGFFDYMEQGGILAIEWSENIAGVLDEEQTIFIDIEKTGETTRSIRIYGGGKF